jgi:hypothetical protein
MKRSERRRISRKRFSFSGQYLSSSHDSIVFIKVICTVGNGYAVCQPIQLVANEWCDGHRAGAVYCAK